MHRAELPGAHDAARICLPCLAMAGIRARPANVDGASFPHTDVGDLDAGLPSLTTEGLRPCLAKRGIATLGALFSQPSWLDTRVTSRRRTRQMIRSVMRLKRTLPQHSCIRNARSGLITSCSSFVASLDGRDDTETTNRCGLPTQLRAVVWTLFHHGPSDAVAARKPYVGIRHCHDS